MNPKTNKLLIFFILVLIVIFFDNYQFLSSLTFDISKIFLLRVFPFLFIMMVLNNLLISLNFPYYLNKIFKNNIVYIFIMSLLSGSPINAVILKEMLDNKMIREKDASIILAFTTFNNPLFLYNYFHLIFHNNLIIIKLFIFIYLGNIFIFLIFKKHLGKTRNSYSYEKVSLSKAINAAIHKAITNLLNIFAIITFFYLLASILSPRLDILSTLFKGLLEITQGLNALVDLRLSTKIKELLVLVILGFAGLSIHMQISLILKNYNINYKYFYLSRLILILIPFLILL